MTPLLNIIFECILDPKHKVNVVKKEVKENLTYGKTALDFVSGKEEFLATAYAKNSEIIDKEVDKAFKWGDKLW